MFILKTKQTRQTDGEAMVQCSLDGFRVLSLNFGGKWKKLAKTRSPETPTFRMYVQTPAPDRVNGNIYGNIYGKINGYINWNIKEIPKGKGLFA